jgi:hypothetical protein
MKYVIKTNKRIRKTAVFRELLNLIDGLRQIISLKWASCPKLVANLESYENGVYMLSYSIDLNGNYLYLSTKGDNIYAMNENLKNNLLFI